MNSSAEMTALLRAQIEFGADEAIADEAIDRFAAPPPAPTPPATPEASGRERSAPPATAPGPSGPRAGGHAPTAARQNRAAPAAGPGGDLSLESPEAIERNARARAAEADSLEALRGALEAFDLCPLKATATNLVFADGNPEAPLMLIGEAPGADEDRQGLPFVGVSGQLLDRMLASIGRDRSSAYVTNILPWRPPGNRKPTTAETTMLLPFIRRHIELAAPRVLVFVGGTSAQSLTGRPEGITRMRGRWLDYHAGDREPIAAMAIFHPAYLLRSPARKREAWQDLLKIREKLES